MPTSLLVARREFLRASASVVGGLALVPPSPAGAVDAASGVPAARLERLRAGANVCRWFRFPRAETPEFFGDYLGDAEAEFMARLGLRHVRLCVAPKIIMDASTGAVREDRARFVEAALRRWFTTPAWR